MEIIFKITVTAQGQ